MAMRSRISLLTLLVAGAAAEDDAYNCEWRRPDFEMDCFEDDCKEYAYGGFTDCGDLHCYAPRE